MRNLCLILGLFIGPFDPRFQPYPLRFSQKIPKSPHISPPYFLLPIPYSLLSTPYFLDPRPLTLFLTDPSRTSPNAHNTYTPNSYSPRFYSHTPYNTKPGRG